jgi:hypothetical protein
VALATWVLESFGSSTDYDWDYDGIWSSAQAALQDPITKEGNI